MITFEKRERTKQLVEYDGDIPPYILFIKTAILPDATKLINLTLIRQR